MLVELYGVGKQRRGGGAALFDNADEVMTQQRRVRLEQRPQREGGGTAVGERVEHELDGRPPARHVVVGVGEDLLVAAVEVRGERHDQRSPFGRRELAGACDAVERRHDASVERGGCMGVEVGAPGARAALQILEAGRLLVSRREQVVDLLVGHVEAAILVGWAERAPSPATLYDDAKALREPAQLRLDLLERGAERHDDVERPSRIPGQGHGRLRLSLCPAALVQGLTRD